MSGAPSAKDAAGDGGATRLANLPTVTSTYLLTEQSPDARKPAFAEAAARIAGTAGVVGMVLSPTASLGDGGRALCGFVAALRKDDPMTGELYDTLTSNGEEVPYTVTALYRVGRSGPDAALSGPPSAASGADYEDTVDLASVRENLGKQRDVFNQMARMIEQTGERVDLNAAGRAPGGVPTFTSTPCCDAESVSVVQAQYQRTTQTYIVARTHLRPISDQLRALAASGGLTVAQFAAHPAMVHAEALSIAHNRRIAATAAEVLGLSVERAVYGADGSDRLAVPVCTWAANTFGNVNLAPPAGATGAAAARRSVLTWHNNTFNTATQGQRGMMLGVSPMDGFQWLFGPRDTAPTGASVGGGGWTSEASLNMFPTGTGRVVSWDATSLSNIEPAHMTRIRTRAGVGGTVGVTRRLYPSAYAEWTNTGAQRTAMAALGYNADNGSMTLQAEAVYMGPPPRRTMDVAYSLRWLPADVQRIAVRVNDPLVTKMLHMYAEEKRTGADEGIFANTDLSTLFGGEADDSQFIYLDRKLVAHINEARATA